MSPTIDAPVQLRSTPADGRARSVRPGGIDSESLAERFGTPLYLYDASIVDRQVAALREVLPPRVEVAYAVKANPALAIVRQLGRAGLGADVASAGELATVVRAGIAPDLVVMTGPGKRDDELAAAVAAGIRAVTVESIGELERLERIAASVGRRQPIMLRAAASDHERERVPIIDDGGAGKFGMDRSDLLAAARVAARSDHVDLIGLHAFAASNVTDAGALIAHAEWTVAYARELAKATSAPLRLVDVGGGLGIPYGSRMAPLDVASLGRGLGSIVRPWVDDPWLRDARLLIEPGRFLVGQSGVYLTRVVDRKSVGGAVVVVVDGGIHHVLRPALVGEEHRVVPCGAGTVPEVPVTVVGPLCSGLDVLARDAVMRVPAVGDLLAVLDTGAYGFTESMPYFLSHPVPAEVLVRDGRAALIRPRRDPAEWLDQQLVPDL